MSIFSLGLCISKLVKIVPCRPGLGGAIVPRSCDHVPQVGRDPCPIDPWVVVPDKSKYVDQQTLKCRKTLSLILELLEWKKQMRPIPLGPANFTVDEIIVSTYVSPQLTAERLAKKRALWIRAGEDYK
ncbi:minichromosome maintenance protein 5 [Datura stramonium]|uniref:Minichromosome maintenance protein 5 n=1 Tax=Datura stramonium TaxID=4076 RepID=A0ABS8UNT8_DATST|nr:minichromosome maintenance protein 5 [Datura stramonium]